MILHCLLISILSAMIRGISEEFHIFQIVFFHNMFAWLCVVPWMLASGGISHVITTRIKLHMGRAFLGVVSLMLYFYAFTVIPLTEARAIALTGPLVSSLLAIIWLKEMLVPGRVVALVIGFAGALIIVQPGTEGFSFVSLYVVIAVGMWSVIDIIVKLLSKTESTQCQLFYLTGGMTLFSLPAALYVWQMPESLVQWLWLAGLGVIFFVNVIAVFNAFKHADVTVVMPFDFMGMVFTAVIAYLAFQEIISVPTMIGGLIIVVSSVYIAYLEKRTIKIIHAKTPASEE